MTSDPMTPTLTARYHLTHDVEVVDVNIGDSQTCPQFLPQDSSGFHLSYNDDATLGWPIDGSAGAYRNVSLTCLRNKADGSYLCYHTHLFLSLDARGPASISRPTMPALLARASNTTQAVRTILQASVLYPSSGEGPWIENNSVHPVTIHFATYT